MTVYKEIQLDSTSIFTTGMAADFSKVIAAVESSIARGEIPFIRPTANFPASFTVTGQPSYESFERGCSNLKARGLIRIHVEATTVTRSNSTPIDTNGMPKERAGVVHFSCKPGQTITIQPPGVLLRSPSGLSAGVPGGQVSKYGILRDLSGKGTADRPRISLDGSFTYTAGAVEGIDDIVFLLIDTKTWTQPYGVEPYFDPETFEEYCGLNRVPKLKLQNVLSYGQLVVRALKPYADKLAFWEAPINEPEYRVFWPRRLREEENAPDLNALRDEVYYPFFNGMKGIGKASNGLSVFTEGGPETGSPDVVRWYLSLPRNGPQVVTFHAYVWEGEKFPDGIVYKLDNWLKPALDEVAWHGQVFITELGDLTPMTPEKWRIMVDVLKQRPWITAAYNQLTGLVEQVW